MVVTQIGINDCGMGLDARKQIQLLFQIQDTLYETGARNFLFLTVPPADRSPAGIIFFLLRS